MSVVKIAILAVLGATVVQTPTANPIVVVAVVFAMDPATNLGEAQAYLSCEVR